MTAREPIIIVGMVRSGTTYLAQLLAENGVVMYDWELCCGEDADLWGWNCAEMQSNRFGENAIPFAYTPSESLLQRLRQYNERRRTDHPWGFKEPQISCHLPAYFTVWPKAKYVCCVRNLLSSAWSAKFRHDILMRESDAMVLGQHVLRLANVVRSAEDHGIEMHYFNYDADPICEFVALSQFLGIELCGWETFKRSQARRDNVHRAEMADALARYRAGLEVVQ